MIVYVVNDDIYIDFGGGDVGPSSLDPLRAFSGWLLIGAIIEKRILRETWTVDYHVDIIC